MTRLRLMFFAVALSVLVGAGPCLAGSDVLTFTSDLHSATSNLSTWYTSLKSGGTSTVNYATFGGDYADSWTPSVFTSIASAIHAQYSSTVIVYTMGNHEYMGGSESAFYATTGYTRTGEKVSTADYAIYTLGAPGTTEQFTSSDIYALQSYLAGVGTSKPVFVVSHFPIHYFGSRTTANAASMITALNDHPNVIFLWGHNHSQGDTNYGVVKLSGSSVQYSSSGSATINFTYLTAGCMKQNVNNSGTYGLVATVTRQADSTIGVVLQYRSLSGNAGSATNLTYGTAAAPVAGDFNADQKADIVWRHSTGGDVWMWPMNGTTRVSETFVRRVADTDWEIRGLGDLTDDLRADILWRNKTTGAIYLWPMNGTAPSAESYVGTVDPAYDIDGTGDFNADGYWDILWRNTSTGTVWIWLMNGATASSKVYVDTVDPAYVITGVGDLNHDGKADIVWHGTLGDVWVWLMNGTTRSSQTWVGTVLDTTYQIEAVADFDGDGKSDILWWNSSYGDAWIWKMNGNSVSSQTFVAMVPDTGYRIVAAYDYNGDTKADILWRHATGGDVWMWLMNGTTMSSETCIGTVPDTGFQVIK